MYEARCLYTEARVVCGRGDWSLTPAGDNLRIDVRALISAPAERYRTAAAVTAAAVLATANQPACLIPQEFLHQQPP